MATELARPTPLSVRAGAIPAELKERLQWVVWRYKLNRQEQWTKVLFRPDGRTARSNDPSSWTSFDRALAAYESGDWDGIGFVLGPGDPYAGVDLDDCLACGSDGQLVLSPTVREIVEHLDSYTEITPSGEGLRVFVRGELPEGSRNRQDDLGVEAYDTLRFFSITGRRLKGTPSGIAERDLTWLTEEYLGYRAQAAEIDYTPDLEPLSQDDLALIEHAKRARNGQDFELLWGGGTWDRGHPERNTGAGKRYESQSNADLALCNHLRYWTGGDVQRIDRLFRHSGLMRAKWDERRGDQTYGARTIARAMDGAAEAEEEEEMGELVRLPGRESVARKGELEVPAPERSEESPALRFLEENVYTARELRDMELPPPKTIVDGIIPEGLTLLTGGTKIGKSLLMLHISLEVARGGKALGKIPVERRKVLYIALEDGKRRLQSRIDEYLDGDDWPDDLAFCNTWPRLDEGGTELIETYLDRHPATALVVLDVLAKVRGESERNRNAYYDDYAVMSTLRDIVDRRGVSIVVVHHTNKLDPDDPFDRISGSKGLSGAVDATLLLSRRRTETDGKLLVTGRDIEEHEYALANGPMRWTLVGEEEIFGLTDERLEVMRALSREMTVSDLAAVLGKTKEATKKLVQRLYDSGRIRRVRRGVYGPIVEA